MKIPSILINTYKFTLTNFKKFNFTNNIAHETREKDIFVKSNKMKELINNYYEAENNKKFLLNKLIEKENLQEVININEGKYSKEFIKYISNYVKKYPELKDKIKKNERFSINFIKEQTFSKKNEYININELSKREQEKLKKIEKTLPKNYFLNWEKIDLLKNEKQGYEEIFEDIYKMLSFVQRLDSVNYKNLGNWAIKNKTIMDCTTQSILEGENFDKVLSQISEGYGSIFAESSLGRGVLRDKDWESITPYNENVYSEYKEKFDKILNKIRKSPFSDIKLTKIVKYEKNGCMSHPSTMYVKKFLNHAKKSYDEIIKIVQKKKKEGNLSIEELKKAEDNIAQIHFLLTNSMPYRRGTSGIANILSRSLYKSLGIDIPPVKHGIALDLEAFCQSLEDYKKNWNMFFDWD